MDSCEHLAIESPRPRRGMLMSEIMCAWHVRACAFTPLCFFLARQLLRMVRLGLAWHGSFFSLQSVWLSFCIALGRIPSLFIFPLLLSVSVDRAVDWARPMRTDRLIDRSVDWPISADRSELSPAACRTEPGGGYVIEIERPTLPATGTAITDSKQPIHNSGAVYSAASVLMALCPAET